MINQRKLIWPFGDLTPLKYGAILCDNPWKYKMRSAKGHAKSPEAHYHTMTKEEIKALPVGQLASRDCYLFMWSTWPHLPQAIEVMEHWGFEYVTGGSWTKRTKNWKLGFGTGYIMRSATEPFLVGKIGAPVRGSRSERNAIFAPDVTLDPEDIGDSIESLKREHSRKPPEMRQMIERLIPSAFYCELFAREEWPGHDVWGNEAGKFDEVGNV